MLPCAKYLGFIVVIIFVIEPLHSLAAPMVFSNHNPQRLAGGNKSNYSHAVLELALEKTRQEFGEFAIEDTPKMSRSREIERLKRKYFPNYFIASVMESRLKKASELTFIEVPIMFGVLGYRVCFYTKNKPQLLKNVFDENKNSIIFGLGKRWPDALVMRHNGLNVSEVETYSGLFRMTGAGRVDMFCRSVNEVKDEYEKYHTVTNLAFDETFAFHYEYPMFFFTHRENTKAIARVKRGLELAYADGSLEALWRNYNQASVDFAALEKRTIIRLKNPLMEGVGDSYKRYLMTPEGYVSVRKK